MTVYLVYSNNDRDGSVNAIFDTERKALDFVIKENLKENCYSLYFKNMDSYLLDKYAREYIVEMTVF